MSAESIRAILDDKKTQTRRVIKTQPMRATNDWTENAEPNEVVMYRGDLTRLAESRGRNKRAAGILTPVKVRCPYGQPGDRLWVRETIYYNLKANNFYFAADKKGCGFKIFQHFKRKTCPSIHMARWASRITLEVVAVRAERVQDIGHKDIIAEGYAEGKLPRSSFFLATINFKNIWDSLNAKRGFGWDENPWVWVIEFRRLRLEEESKCQPE